MTVIPADEVSSAIAALKLDAGDVHGNILGCTGGEDDCVVVLLQIIHRDVHAIFDIAKKADVSTVQNLTQCTNDALDARVVWSNAITDQAVGGRKGFKEIDRDIEIALCLQSNICCINTSGTGANNGQTKLVHGV